MMYFFYIVRCSDNSLYSGQTNDLDKRIKIHNTDNKKSSKYTRSRRPVILVHFEKYDSLQQALKREREVKKFSKEKKERLVLGETR